MADFNISFGTFIDQNQFSQQLSELNNTVTKAPPLKLNVQLEKQLLKTGDAEQIFKTISQNATAVDNLIVKQRTLQTESGKSYKAVTEFTLRYKDALGQVVTELYRMREGTELAGKSGIKFDLIQSTAATNTGKRVAQIEAAYQKYNTQFNTMMDKANQWTTRSMDMGEKERNAIQGTSAALAEKIARWKELIAAGDVKGANALVQGIQNLNKELDKNIALSKRAAEGVRSWGTRMGDAIKQTIAYTFSYRLLNQAMMELREAMKFIIDLNTEMVKIQVLQAEGAQTDEEIRSLAVSYNELGQEMGATTIEIAQGSVEWLRQGKTVAETSKLLESSLMLAKLGNLSAAESTEYLTSVLNSYNLTAEESIGIVDRLIQVDNNSATSTKELATALRYVAASAQQAGVSIEQLISYVAVISSTTRLNAEQIGQALKTIFTRMQDIKQGQIDEDGLGLNNVERALARVDIKLRETDTEFRDMGAVLEELAGKWATLNEVEQANIAKAISGVRQANMFQILMREMAQAQELQALQMDASGLATQRYGYYLNSVVGQQTIFKAKTEELILSFKDFDKAIIQILKLANAFLDLINAIGGLPSILVIATAALVIFNATWIKTQAIAKVDAIVKMVSTLQLYIAGLRAATSAQEAFNYVLATTKLLSGGLVTIAIAMVAAMFAITASIPMPTEKLKRLNDEFQKLTDEFESLKTEAQTAQKLAEEYTELSQKKPEALTADETQRLIDVQNELKGMLPELTGYYDEYGNFIISTSESMETLTQKIYENIKAMQEKRKAEIEETSGRRAKTLEDAYTTLKMGEVRGTRTKEQLAQMARDYNDALGMELSNFSLMGRKAQEEFIKGLTNPELIKIFKDYMNDLLVSTADSTEVSEGTKALARSLTSAQIDELTIKPTLNADDFMAQMESVASGMEKLNKIREKLAEGKTLDIEDMAQLRDMGVQLQFTSEGFSLTEESVKAYKDSLIETIVKTYELTDVQEKGLRKQLEYNDAVDESKQALDNISSELDAVSNAMTEQEEAGSLTADTVYELVTKYAELAPFITQVGDAFIFDTEAARQHIQGMIYDQIALYGVADASIAASKGQYELALQMLQTAGVARSEIMALRGLISELGALGMPAITTGGGGGGESAATKAERERLEDLKDEKEAEKDALKEKLANYKKIIDARKELLKSYKEELDYRDELGEKEKKVSQLQAELAAISLDNSEEAQSRRLELQAELDEAQTDLDKTQRDRAYELQMEALDKEYEAYKEMIDAQIALIDKFIDRIGDLIDALSKAAGGSGGSGGYVPPPPSSAPPESYVTQKCPICGKIVPAGLLGVHKATVHGISGGGGDRGLGYHEGLDRGFVGGLETNEEFLKLMKGELVINPAQMGNFMNKTLPQIVSTVRGGDIRLEMPITVEGNLDKSVVPDLEKLAEKIMGQLNKTMTERGYMRTVDKFGV